MSATGFSTLWERVPLRNAPKIDLDVNTLSYEDTLKILNGRDELKKHSEEEIKDFLRKLVILGDDFSLKWVEVNYKYIDLNISLLYSIFFIQI